METGRTQKVRIRPPLLRRASRTRRAQQARTLQQKLEVWHQGRIRKLGLRRAARDPWLVTGEDRNEKCWNGVSGQRPVISDQEAEICPPFPKTKG